MGNGRPTSAASTSPPLCDANMLVHSAAVGRVMRRAPAFVFGDGHGVNTASLNYTVNNGTNPHHRQPYNHHRMLVSQYQRQHNVPSASGQPMGTSSVQSYNNYTDHDQSYSRVIGGLASSMGDGPGNSLLQGDSTRSTSAAASTTGPTSGSGQATGAESSQISVSRV